MSARIGGTVVICVLAALIVPGRLLAAEIYLTDSVVDQNTARTFADICFSPQSSEASVSAALGAPLPSLGDRPTLVPTRTIRDLLSARLGDSFVLVGGRLLYLPAGVTDEGRRSFYIKLLSYLNGLVADESVRIEVSIPQGQPLSGIDADSKLSFTLPAGAGSPQALIRNTFVQFRIDGEPGTLSVPVSITASGVVAYLRHPVAFGGRIGKSDLYSREVDLSSLAGAPVPLDQSTYVARTALPADAPVLDGQVRREAAVDSGKAITLTFVRGIVEVSVPGTAYGVGMVGEIVPVAPTSSTQRYTGRIVSPTEVVIDEE